MFDGREGGEMKAKVSMVQMTLSFVSVHAQSAIQTHSYIAFFGKRNRFF